jgi:hypothetical protein
LAGIVRLESADRKACNYTERRSTEKGAEKVYASIGTRTHDPSTRATKTHARHTSRALWLAVKMRKTCCTLLLQATLLCASAIRVFAYRRFYFSIMRNVSAPSRGHGWSCRAGRLRFPVLRVFDIRGDSQENAAPRWSITGAICIINHKIPLVVNISDVLRAPRCLRAHGWRCLLYTEPQLLPGSVLPIN